MKYEELKRVWIKQLVSSNLNVSLLSEKEELTNSLFGKGNETNFIILFFPIHSRILKKFSLSIVVVLTIISLEGNVRDGVVDEGARFVRCWGAL